MEKLKSLLLTGGMHGMISQVEGMAKALNAEFDHKIVRLRFPWNFVPPKLTYLTNDGKTRFNPNLYRNGKVCISLLNTWKGEQWTSCQTIESILLSLVALLHNEPLLNEPGIKKTHRDFKSYNSIIQYKNYETAILGILTQKILPPAFSGFFSIIKKHFKEHEKNILAELTQLEQSKKNRRDFKTSLYNMNISANYTDLMERMKIAFKEFLN